MHSQLLRVTAFLIGIAGASLSATVVRGAGGDLWMIPVGLMCVAQDVKYREMPFGRRLIPPSVARGDFESRPVIACFRQRRWASEALCNDLMMIDERTRSSDTEALYNKHRREIAAMEALSDYLKDALSPNPTLPCPESLAAAPRAAPPPARPTCPARPLTEADARRWSGTPLEKLSDEMKTYVTDMVQMDELMSEIDRRAALHGVAGRTGAAAIKDLRDKGFTCQFDRWVYRCSIIESTSCLCRRFQISISFGSQIPGGQASDYQRALDSLVLDSRSVGHMCFRE